MRFRPALVVLIFLAISAWPSYLAGVTNRLPAGTQAHDVRARSLDIYFVDVEGGQAVLIVTPWRESLLIDAGWADFDGRDAKRIMRVAKLAGIDHIDYLLVTHYDGDHVGGVPQLAERIPIRVFIDHGNNVQESDRDFYSAYLETARKGKRWTVKPGDIVPLKGVKVVIVTAAGEHLQKSLANGGQINPYCSETKPIADEPIENARSLGLILIYGKFRFVDLGDLVWNREIELMCPKNPLGSVDAFVTSHHGGANANSKALVWALRPRVTVVDNSAKKGNSPEAWKRIHDAPGCEGIWQLHYSIQGGKRYNSGPDYIANGESLPDKGNHLKLSAHSDGRFTMTNSRNDFTMTYPSRNSTAQ